MRRLGLLVGGLFIFVAINLSPTQVARAAAAKPVAYLTYDDGPHPVYTPQILDLLDRYNAKATFFVIGQQIAEQPAIFERIMRSGHAIGSHSWAHEELTRRSDAQIASSMAATNSSSTQRGYPLRCMRPPYGATSARVNGVLTSAGYSVHLWDVDTFDWKRPGADRIAATVERFNLTNKQVLMHDGGGAREQTVAATARFLAKLSSIYDFQPMPDCVSDKPIGSLKVDGAPTPSVPDGQPLRFSAIVPTRAVDTRQARVPLAAAETRRVAMPANAQAAAAAINLTATNATATGFLTAWNCDAPQPATSNSNFAAGTTRAVSSVVRVSATNELCVFASARTDVIVDVTGWFSATGMGFESEAPRRLLDTRDTATLVLPGRVTRVPASADAAALAVNLTVTDATAAGFVTAFSCDQPPPAASSLNFEVGQTIANSAYLATGPGGLCFITSAPVHIIVDRVGAFVANGGREYQPAHPRRLLDTRNGIGGWMGPTGAGQTLLLGQVPGAAAVVMVTSTRPDRTGYVTVWNCDGPAPGTSTLNTTRGETTPNGAVLPTNAAGAACLRASGTSDLIIDLQGWFAP